MVENKPGYMSINSVIIGFSKSLCLHDLQRCVANLRIGKKIISYFVKFDLDPIPKNLYSPPLTNEHTTARKQRCVPELNEHFLSAWMGLHRERPLGKVPADREA
jgi:hypothetical protein